MPRDPKPPSRPTRLLSPLCSPEFVVAVRALAEAEGHGSVGEFLVSLIAAAAQRRGVVLPERMPGHGGSRPVRRADDRRKRRTDRASSPHT